MFIFHVNVNFVYNLLIEIFLSLLFKKDISFILMVLIVNLLQYLYINPELTNNNLYFFETSLAAVLFPLADSPSQAIINLFIFFTKMY